MIRNGGGHKQSGTPIFCPFQYQPNPYSDIETFSMCSGMWNTKPVGQMPWNLLGWCLDYEVLWDFGPEWKQMVCRTWIFMTISVCNHTIWCGNWILLLINHLLRNT
jgi:hypothetical protein